MASNNPNAIDTLTPFDSERARMIGAKGGAAKKGSKHINTWIQELLTDEDFTSKIQVGKKIIEFKGAPLKAIIQAQMRKAVDGDTKAFDSLAKYGWPSKTETDLHVKELPKPLLNGLSSNNSDSEDTQPS